MVSLFSFRCLTIKTTQGRSEMYTAPDIAPENLKQNHATLIICEFVQSNQRIQFRTNYIPSHYILCSLI